MGKVWNAGKRKHPMRVKVFIRGNYGPSNLGDDVLMLMMIRAVTEVISADEVSVEVKHTKLASRLFPGVKFVENGSKDEIDAKLLIYGGGGQFFSFQDYYGFKLQLQRLIRLLSGDIRLAQLYDSLKRKKPQNKRVHVKAAMQYAFGIGLGPFAKNSSENMATQKVIQNCSVVTVRDDTSKSICDEWNIIGTKVIPDPTFLSELWLEGDINYSNSYHKCKQSIGVIIRSWPFDTEGKYYLKNLIKAVNGIRKKGMLAKYISLSNDSDNELIQKLNRRGEDILIWDPSKNTPHKFMEFISENFDFVISARAHGIILPATHGVPGICIGIEEKLNNIHEMLPNSTKLWSFPFRENQLMDMINDMIKNNNEFKAAARDEARQNKYVVSTAMDEMKAVLNNL
jgi:polysaccharide pyruvyl transferase WcaK-like protein